MKTRIVLWGTNEAAEKKLLAIQLRPEDNQFDVWQFAENEASDEFSQKLMDEWRIGKPLEFPPHESHLVRDLQAGADILPEGIKAEKEDLINRARTEWLFVVMSHKAYQAYQSQLDLTKEKLNGLTEYSKEMWEEVKTFWGRIQDQMRERNLSREHGDKLKEGVNEVFERLKAFRKEMDVVFDKESEINFDKLNGKIQDIMQRIQTGKVDWSRIFNDLKQTQSEYHSAKLGKNARNTLWNSIDATFKKAKELRFGNSSNDRSSGLDRLGKRISGLEEVIKDMNRSIERDEQDLKFFEEKLNSPNVSQLESQLREAKMVLVKERFASKQAKLADMEKTLRDLNAQYDKIQADDERKKVVDAKKAEIAAQKKAESAAHLEENKEQLAKAAAVLQADEPKDVVVVEANPAVVAEVIAETPPAIEKTTEVVAEVPAIVETLEVVAESEVVEVVAEETPEASTEVNNEADTAETTQESNEDA